MKTKLNKKYISFSVGEGLGNVEVSAGVIKKIVALSISDISGVSLPKSGDSFKIKELFFGEKQSTKGIHIKLKDSAVRIFIELVVEQGIIIPTASKEVQSRVREAVENMTGLKVSSVDIKMIDASIVQ